MKYYYIMSLKHTHGIDQILWWRDNNSGYTINLDLAGKYTEDDVTKHASYYDNNDATRAILCDSVDKFANRVVSIDLLDNIAGNDRYVQTSDGLIARAKYQQYMNDKRTNHSHDFIDDECWCGELND